MKPWLLSKDVLDLTKSGLSKKYRLVFISYLLSSLPTRAVLRCGLSDPALSIKVRTFHAPIRKGITLAFFFVFRPLKGIPADRG